ncbi:MAG: alpha/beta fold hydrolase [Pseudomonadota bacterium]
MLLLQSTFSSAELPVEAFAGLPVVDTALLSPNGEYLATQINVEGITHITTLKLGGDAKPTSVLTTDNREFRVNWFQWVNDEQLFVSIRYPRTMFTGTDVMERELFTVKRDGSGLKKLIDLRRARWVPQFRDQVIDFMPDDPGYVLMSLDMERPGAFEVFRVNVETGSRKRVERARQNVRGWFTDRQHRVRGRIRMDDGKTAIEISDPDGNNWRTRWEFGTISADRISPMGFDYDPNILYVRAYHQGRLAVFRVDLQDETLAKELIYADERYDVEGGLLYSRRSNKVLGLRNSREGNAYVIWDPAFRAVVDSINAALPDTQNVLIDTDQAENRYILYAGSATDAGTFYFGDLQSKQLSPFARPYPQLAEVALVGKEKVIYTASDGVAIEGYLSLPQKRKPGEKLPSIVFPHGGPAARTSPGFDYWTEFLVDRGYAVLEMDFRGSSGQGFAWMARAFRNWDQVTQQDIADGARYLINEGIADPGRICIVGASFGGYAAMMGAVRPDSPYRCAISIAGVSDLLELRNTYRRFLNAESMERQIGSDGDRLKAASPITYVESMQKPLLLIHGVTDRVVPVTHSQIMNERLVALGKPVTYVELPSGDHYLSNHFDRVETFKVMDRFLKENL